MFEWIKRHKVKCVIIVISLIFLPMILINCLFKLSSSCDFFVAEWLPDNALLYWGSCLSFIGTVSLGAVAVWQNYNFKLQNDKFNEKVLKLQIFSGCAYFKSASCKIQKDTRKLVFSVIFKNIGKSLAVAVIPVEFEFSKYAFKTSANRDDIVTYTFDEQYSNISIEGLIKLDCEFSAKIKIKANEFYFAHITLSIVSENQMQYNQIIQLKFQYINKQFRFINEYVQYLELYE